VDGGALSLGGVCCVGGPSCGAEQKPMAQSDVPPSYFQCKVDSECVVRSALAKTVHLNESTDEIFKTLMAQRFEPSIMGEAMLRETLRVWSVGVKEADLLYKLVTDFGVEPKIFGISGPSALDQALMTKKTGLAKKMLQDGAPAHYIQPDGSCILHALSSQETQASSEMLMELMADKRVAALIRQKDKKGLTPLHWAAKAMSLEKMAALLAAGADPNAKDDKGDAPMRHLLRRFGKKANARVEACMELLIKNGADASMVNAKGKTALQASIATAPASAIEKLAVERPDDLLSMSVLAKQALRKLEKRLRVGLSLSEKIQLQQWTTVDDSKLPTKKRSRL
jgi:ankyrin repeat protein